MSDPSKQDLIKSVRTVFSEAIKSKKHFTIPTYQRGYKWNRDNVWKLLSDLKSFERSSSNDSKSFYCIQNITIVPSKDNLGWNVVDGQQRLTTIYILLSFLRKFRQEEQLNFFSDPKCLNYTVREATGNFLKDSIYNGKVWENEIYPDKAMLKDEWYILDVAKGIKDWFDTKGNFLNVSTLTDRLMLIVNNMENQSVSEEEIFAGLNSGKVDLDGADLVRAELITRSAKEKYQGSLASKVKEFRMRIALELDEMNLWWGKTEQKKYFEQFLPENSFRDTSFDHNMHSIGLLYKLYFLIYHKENEKFGIRFFENGIDLNEKSGDDHWELYESLMQLHRTLKLWFTDSLLYHWIGFLIYRFKGQHIINESTIGFKFIWQLWKSSTTKAEFLGKIISQIQTLMNSNGQFEIIKNIKDTNYQWYGKNSKGITDILVLMDVMKCTGIYIDLWNQKENDEKPAIGITDMKAGKLRLPSAYLTKTNENFEHIRSCAPNDKEGKEVREKNEWINHIEKIYANAKKDSEEWIIKEAILNILRKFPEDTLDDNTIAKLNNEMNKFGQHSIGNLALLDEHVNKSYGNDPFQKKIQRIFSEYMNDEWYIRPYTMIVFEHKIKDSDRSWRWTQENITENANNIANNIELLLKMKL